MRIVVALCLWLLLCSAGKCHLLPKQNATINVVDRSAYVVVSVPKTAFKEIADIKTLESQIAARLHIRALGVEGKAVLTMVMAPHADAATQNDADIVAMHRVDFSAPPTQLSIDTDLFGTARGSNQMTITATHGKKSEIAILEPAASSYTFFREPFENFQYFVGKGVNHILGGLDHLLFLVTIIVGTTRVRYWIAILTSFTLAHSITLSLSALNLLRLPSHWIEPGIALSLVLVALVNAVQLRHANMAGAEQLRLSGARLALVFMCGLLHGLGFAGAVGALSNNGVSRLLTLAGFNLGVELGQLLFVGAFLIGMALLSRLGSRTIYGKIPLIANLSAALLGTFLLTQQLFGTT